MKLLVFAHIPPPHHGQSLMVQVLVNGFGGDRRQRTARQPPDGAGQFDVEVYHVNARLSGDMEDVGAARGGKVFTLLKYCVQAVSIRLRHGVRTLYYVPAPAKRAPLIRDWIAMALCRPFFDRLVLHWHAVGLGAWLKSSARPWERWLTHRLLGHADLALVLSEFSRGDAQVLHPRRSEVVANGIADPCPTCEYELLPWRLERRAKLAEAMASFAEAGGSQVVTGHVLYLAHCTRDKGLFDAVEAVSQANRLLADRRAGLRLELTVAGEFLTDADRTAFNQLRVTHAAWVRYAGFVHGDAKEALFRTADAFLFPTYYANEGQPVALIEAMAYALPIVTTRWRAIPEALPAGYPGLIEPRRTERAAEALLRAVVEDGQPLREQYARRFSIATHLSTLATALRTVQQPSPAKS